MAFATKLCPQSLVLQTMLVGSGRRSHPGSTIGCQNHSRSLAITGVFFRNPYPYVLQFFHVLLLFHHHLVAVSGTVAEMS